ncbi:helix-turn-helix domain-containing protein [Haloprofundus salilacus]|uniref:helix-turn-helix domain-containing protein n=1 Tax=Haloprofundus salilacus TaxID=2876190 RepID=UPI001CCAA198|nr:helix-turn-helix domain-containing protein [Haloprofundus salilacus]
MGIVTEFSIPAESFALSQTFDRVPDLLVEVDRLATHSREWVLPFFWASSETESAAVVREAIEADPTVKELNVVDAWESVALYNVHWSEEVQQLVDEIIDQHGIVLSAEAHDGLWSLKIRFIDRSMFDDFRAYFADHDLTFELERIHEMQEPKQREYGLTPPQRETLVAAFEMGYFTVPRKANITDLADELGVSPNAVSQRLRRANAALVQNALLIDEQDDGRTES